MIRLQISKVLRVAFWVCAIAVLVLSLVPITAPMPSTGWDKTNHLLAFATLAFLGRGAFPGRTVAVLAGLLVYGGVIEVLQSFTPDRSAEWTDLLADGIGLLLGEMLTWLSWRRVAKQP
ncbi:VanZ family protein [Variovorax boronicumulans]|uniref:VanZ family protein n=1 Tax=Variovorax boronicumulans TaxID=436515 RepID=UPI0024763B8D|nr:VanZ family protein [Variovorax boronicumulans]MDH6166713.1 VanZ family protein [Variovorax boronicumulans]